MHEISLCHHVIFQHNNIESRARGMGSQNKDNNIMQKHAVDLKVLNYRYHYEIVVQVL